MRKKILVGNWKMNKFSSEAREFVKNIEEMAVVAKENNIIVGIAPTFLSLEAANSAAVTPIVSAQNCHFEDSGAFTGEVSVPMLVDLGVKYCLVGHSERRQYFAETDETVNKKIKSALEVGLKPIVCVGETLEQRESGVTEQIITAQVEKAFEGIEASQLDKIIVAYEPIWAIGTGKTATSEDANEAIKAIRNKISEIYGQKVAQEVIIQYGGSVKSSNAKELFEMSDIDGGLVGGASLKADEFSKIVEYK